MHFLSDMNLIRAYFLIGLLAVDNCFGDQDNVNKESSPPNYRDTGSSSSSPSPVDQRQRSFSRGYSVMESVHNQGNKGSDSCYDDLSCSIVGVHDRHGLEAIKFLHGQLDDDANGAVDLSESDDFLREELQYGTGAERRQRAFHRNDDKHISVKELWEAWVRSEVHNWTVEQTAEWLSVGVGLPQYAQTFIAHAVNGATLPRLAVSNMQYLSNVLGIKDPIHKQKIALKAMDVVLFGPPKDAGTYVKDIIMITLLLGTLFGFWYAYRMNKSSHMNLNRMMKNMESLQKAELALENLQKELEVARQRPQDDKAQNVDQNCDGSEMKMSYSDLEMLELKAENERLRSELQRAEGELVDKCWSPPLGLQQWLQYTYELESKTHVKKKVSAEKQLQSARDACEKLRKKRSSLVGAFVSTHGKSIDDVDKSIVEARTLLNEVTQELAERVHRWKKIEALCGFNIINNRGLDALATELYKGVNGRGLSIKSRMSSQDDLDDDTASIATSGYDNTAGGADSSGSEKLEGDDESIAPTEFGVDFIVGGDSPEEFYPRSRKPVGLFNARERAMTHSHSQDIISEQEGASLVKSSHSETSLEFPVLPPVAHPRQKKHHAPLRPDSMPSGFAFEEETYSTDSNSTVADEFSPSEKLKKSKIRFPKFTRKSRQTPPPEKHS
ncbi:stromal interaction molecule [Nesidiocoris tenuis]|uniref:Stromal interaction molecule n=1 Tax=Nesidiocoris tenuis TaxID=355587 RepID=A0ABN7AK78_9HEMI|nr:stromal interaction molecule [Nesidiocoris tenuis]